MASVLKISDGTTTVNFLSGTTYRVSDWQPAVATRRNSDLGGRGPYEDVVEVMVLSIKSSTALADLGTLQKLMDQAERWAKGEPVDAVLLHYKPTASSEELKTPILGAAGDSPIVELPPNFVYAAQTGMIDGIVLRFRRLGLWLGEDDDNTSGVVGQGFVQAINMTTACVNESPFSLQIVDIEDFERAAFGSYILVSSGPSEAAAESRVHVFEAEDLDLLANGFTSVLDTTNEARGDYVLRYTPSSTDEKETDFKLLSSDVDQDARRWAVFLSYRNNSGSTSFNVKGVLNGDAAAVPHFTPVNYIPAGVSTPAWLFLGVVTMPYALAYLRLRVTASAASGTLDIDAIALLAVDEPATDRAVAILEKDSDTEFADLTLSEIDLYVHHRLLTHTAPGVYFWPANDDYLHQSYQGDAALFMKSGATHIAAVWLAKGGDVDSDWTVTNDAGSNYSCSFKIVRNMGYLIPQ